MPQKLRKQTSKHMASKEARKYVMEMLEEQALHDRTDAIISADNPKKSKYYDDRANAYIEARIKLRSSKYV